MQWKRVFEGQVGDRRVQIEVFGDRESFRATTTQKQNHADPSYFLVIDEGSAIEASGDDRWSFKQDLLNCEFSEGEAEEICRQALTGDTDREYTASYLGGLLKLSGNFSQGIFSVMHFPPGVSRTMRAPSSEMPAPTVLKQLKAHNLMALREQLDRHYPGHGDIKLA